jgi:hypothetical protein
LEQYFDVVQRRENRKDMTMRTSAIVIPSEVFPRGRCQDVCDTETKPVKVGQEAQWDFV